jgi:hypothetical protein
MKIINPLAVSAIRAFEMIDVGVTKGYELINSGELDSFTIGRARRITTESINAFVERRLAEQKSAS